MQEMISYSKSIEVRHDVDLFIGGGGPAGIAAAVTAARQGLNVFLVDGCACLGGMGTAGLVPAFMQFSDGVSFLAAGIGKEIFDRLNATREGVMKDYTMSIPAETLKRLYDQMLAEAGVQFSLQTNVVDVITKGSKVTTAICNGKSGFFAVRAKMFVDGTGDGDLAVWAGAPWEKGDEDGNMMPGTLCSLWGDVDWDKYLAFRASAPDAFRKLLFKSFEDGVFKIPDPHHPGMWRVDEHTAGGNIGHAFGVDSTDERSLTKHLVHGREQILEFRVFYRKYIPGFENAKLVSTGSLLGIRESRRIMGDYVLNVDDFIKRAIFDDEIGRYCYPIDIHPTQPNAKAYAAFEEEFKKKFRYAKGESYGIPYRTLTPSGLDNLLVAGRCISCDRKIEGSVRVMPGCYITGQAAGMAASIACKLNTTTRNIPITTLLSNLKAMGAHLPNFAG